MTTEAQAWFARAFPQVKVKKGITAALNTLGDFLF